jgi:hypothetical protein
MSRVSALIISLLLALLAWPAAAASLVASVDRTRLGAGETLELTLQSDDPTQFGKPDLSALDVDFEVRDTRQINRVASLDSDAPADTRWIVSLLPRHAGSLVVPALSLGDARSERIIVQVLVATDADSATE